MACLTTFSPSPLFWITWCACLLWSSVALAQYDFSEECVPSTFHEVYREAPPALIILDRSGSMNSRGNSEGDSKMSIAQTVISEVSQSVHANGPCASGARHGCDAIKLGLGWFSSSAALSVMPAEDTSKEIIKRVQEYTASGGTHVGKGARLIFLNEALASFKNIAIGVLITDGQPSAGNGTRDTVEETLQYLCAARDRRPGQTLTFSVGFGQGASPEMNALFAAAGGTGECCIGTFQKCTYQPREMIDPCKLPRRLNGRIDSSLVTRGSRSDSLASNVQCRGELQADSGQALKDSFQGIFGRATCTFPVDVPPDYPSYPSAEADPQATRVVMDHRTLGPNTRIPYVGDQYVLKPGDFSPTRREGAGKSSNASFQGQSKSAHTSDRYDSEGWIWANPQRTAILLTDNMCQDVVYAQRVSQLQTQIACQCQNTDEACEVPCFREGCLQAFGCASKSGSAKEACEQSCKYDKHSTCEQGTNELYDRQELQQVGRCSPGIISCILGKEFCQPDYTAQPEICNGLDDNCNALTDDLSSAKPGSLGVSYDPADPGQKRAIDASASGQSLFCGFQDDQCGCAGAPDGYGTPMAVAGEASGLEQMAFEAERGTSSCGCIAALGLDQTPATVAPVSGDPVSEGCASSGRRRAPLGGGELLGLVLGLVLGRRRWR